MTQTLTLPSGATATLRPGTGADLAQARKMVEQPDDLSFALLALLLTVNGAELDLAGVKDLDMFDGFQIAEAAGLNPASSPDTLPSGKAYVIRQPKFGDVQAAQRQVDAFCDLEMCLVAVLVTIDGERLLPTDVAELPLADALVLSKAVESLGPTPAPSKSPS